jgi:hypothetical protein
MAVFNISESERLFRCGQELEHGRSARTAFAFEGFAPVLHCSCFSLLDLALGLAFHAICCFGHNLLLFFEGPDSYLR